MQKTMQEVRLSKKAFEDVYAVLEGVQCEILVMYGIQKTFTQHFLAVYIIDCLTLLMMGCREEIEM